MRKLICCSTMAAALMLPNMGSAQGGLSLDPNLNSSLEPAPRVVYGNPGGSPIGPMDTDVAWGSQEGATWIAASQFAVRANASSPTLTYAGNLFFNSPGGAGTRRYYAQLQVEPGVAISHLTCAYIDVSETENIGFSWQKYITDFDSGNTTSQILDSFVTSGSPGVAFEFLIPSSLETMQVFDPATGDLVNHYIAVDVGALTSFAGCYAFWTRQIAPGPLTATFSDVPTSHPFFQFVEALVDSGVTSGCGGGNYCPNSPVTRGQMAVFLAKALGMGFPY